MMRFFTYPRARQEEDGAAAGVSLRRLILMRWVAVIGQAAALLVVQFGVGFDLPIGPSPPRR
jgi:two-component system, sensor histidine kinase RegB